MLELVEHMPEALCSSLSALSVFVVGARVTNSDEWQFCPPLECVVTRDPADTNLRTLCVLLTWDAKHRGDIDPPWPQLPEQSETLAIAGGASMPSTTIVVLVSASKWKGHFARLCIIRSTHDVWQHFFKAAD